MRRYETIYILRPNLGEDDINEIVEKTNGVIESDGGKIVLLDRWGLKKLAYLIKKESQGYYVYTEYAGTPAAVDEIERLFRINDKVLKYLTVKLQDVFDDTASFSAKEEAEETEEVATEEAATEASSNDSAEDKDSKE